MASRGSNEVNSCIFKYGMNLPSSVTHLVKFSDRCYGQNLNINSIVADLFLLQETSFLTTIDSKFYISGHTHMEVDIAHAVIERYKKKYSKNVETPDDWEVMIGKASKDFDVKKMTSKDFFDFSENLKQKLVYRKTNTLKKPWNFEELLWIRVEKQHPFTFKYKTTYDANEQFKQVSLIRKNERKHLKGKSINLTASLKYPADNVNPIKKDKKRDLLQLLKYIKPENHKFYKDLKETDD